MDLTNIDEFLQIFTKLPTSLQIVIVIVFFLAPKIIQLLGGNKVIGGALSRTGLFLERMMKRYQARREIIAESQVLTEAYTRTLVIEALGMFSTRLRRIDRKVNYTLSLLEPKANIEIIEESNSKRESEDTATHNRLHERLRALREENERNGEENL